MNAPERPSKTQRKREMTALQRTGEELVALNPEQLAQLDLPERLFEAVVEAQRIRDFEGRRRQLQYVGKLMREVDPAQIRARLEQWRTAAHEQVRLQRLAERWRQRLLDDAGALALFAADYPAADLRRLRALIAAIRHDLSLKRPPKNHRDLFRAVRGIIAGSSAAGGSDDAA